MDYAHGGMWYNRDTYFKDFSCFLVDVDGTFVSENTVHWVDETHKNNLDGQGEFWNSQKFPKFGRKSSDLSIKTDQTT